MPPKWSQNPLKIDARTSLKNASKKHWKNIKKACENGVKIHEQSMKNRCRNGCRRRDEKRTFEVRNSIKNSNPRILKKYEKPLVL